MLLLLWQIINQIFKDFEVQGIFQFSYGGIEIFDFVGLCVVIYG